MKWKKFLIISLLVIVTALLPMSLGAVNNNNEHELCGTVLEYPVGTKGVIDSWELSSPCGQSILFVIAGYYNPTYQDWSIDTDGIPFGGGSGLLWVVQGIGTSTATVTENIDSRPPEFIVVVYECECPKKGGDAEEVEEVWMRNHDFQCWQVWVNDDNAFEFVFVWEYENNNHVQILDQAGNIVFYTDLPKGDCHFVADLPDGTYTVQNYHEYGHILREFVISKP